MTWAECEIAIREREAKATPGPWTCQLSSFGSEISAQESDGEEFAVATVYSLDSDEDFIAHARTDIPDALAELTRRDEVIRERETSIKRLEERLANEKSEDAKRADAIRRMVPEYAHLWAPLDAVKHVCELLQERGEVIRGLREENARLKAIQRGSDAPGLERWGVNLKVRKLHPDAKLPTYAMPGDAGMDLFALEAYLTHPEDLTFIRTGVAVEIPDGFVGLIWDKSGLSQQGFKVMGGVIDSGYRGEIIVMLYNASGSYCDIKKGRKIAQLIIQPVIRAEPEWAEELSVTDRGAGGFGSTGK